jgi:PTS system nitrogen regulatory IIA component
MDIATFLTPDRIALDLRLRDKQQVLQDLARRAAGTGLTPDTLPALLERERLGSTGLGKGFALPHARIDGLDHYFGLFVRLTRPIDYEAIDGEPVDLVFLLLMPGQEQSGNGASTVGALAAVARRFRDPETVARLRRCQTPAAAHAILTAV